MVREDWVWRLLVVRLLRVWLSLVMDVVILDIYWFVCSMFLANS